MSSELSIVLQVPTTLMYLSVTLQVKVLEMSVSASLLQRYTICEALKNKCLDYEKPYYLTADIRKCQNANCIYIYK